jgi:hypothetical protein
MLASALLALTLAGPGTPCAPGDTACVAGAKEPLRDTILSYVGAIDGTIDPGAWRALGPEAEPILAELAESAGELPTRRARALEGLAALGGARAEALHLRAARGTALPRAVRSAALRGLGRLLPSDRLVRELRPLLDDRDRMVQAAAADVLARRAPAAGCEAIRARALGEGRSGRGRLAAALTRCGR